jgi:hypothetical protein
MYTGFWHQRILQDAHLKNLDEDGRIKLSWILREDILTIGNG